MADSGRTITFSVAVRRTVNARFRSAMLGRKEADQISFASAELLMRVLTTKRLELLQAMAGQGALTIRKIAALVDRDIKPVHGDVTALLKAGVLDKTERGVEFPYDTVHVDFTLTKKAA